mgnify:CR=1 FL=1
MSVCAIRGATCLDVDDAGHMSERVAELMEQMLTRNTIEHDDIISIILTCTPDLKSAFPAAAVRAFGITATPLLCAQEVDVAGALSRVVRIMAHVEAPLQRSQVQHVYIRGAEVLRPDTQK